MFAAVDTTALIVAVFGFLGVIGTAVIPAVLLLKGQKDMKGRIGTPGDGPDIASQQSTAIAQNADIAERLDGLSTQLVDHAKLDTLRFNALDAHIGLVNDEPQPKETPA